MPASIHQRSLEKVSDAKVRKLSQDISDKSGSSVESVSSVMLEGGTKAYTSFEECENDALRAVNAGRQGTFSRIVLQSPSPHSFRLGILFAAKLNWCNALRSLLLAAQAARSITVDESDVMNTHPLFDEYFRQDKHVFSPNLASETALEEFALLAAVIDGSSEAVRVLAEFIGPNFADLFGKPFLSFVYLNQDKASRRKCLRIILPKLELSDANLIVAAENGDFPSVEKLVERMKVTGRFTYFIAACRAMERGHDEIAKWIISQPGLIPWKRYSGSLLLSAIKAQNLGMLTFLSQHMPESKPFDLGTYHPGCPLVIFEG